jgi:hypothetical protein
MDTKQQQLTGVQKIHILCMVYSSERQHPAQELDIEDYALPGTVADILPIYLVWNAGERETHTHMHAFALSLSHTHTIHKSKIPRT